MLMVSRYLFNYHSEVHILWLSARKQISIFSKMLNDYIQYVWVPNRLSELTEIPNSH